jgi:CubicO group peptidase (beta-lactamase class C family)
MQTRFKMAAVFGAALAQFAISSAISAEPAESDKAQKLLTSVISIDKGPGIAASVSKDGRVVWNGAAGLADLEWRRPMTPQTRGRIGSVSKPFTAALALKLAQEKRLKLDEPVVIAGFGKITPRHLATHTSGIRHYDFANFAEANNMNYYSDPLTTLDSFKNDPLLSAPGVAFHYSSLGYNVLGIIAAQSFGGSYADALASVVVKPLGLDDTLPNDSLAIIPSRASGYTIAAQNPLVPALKDGELINTIYRDDSDLYPSGGLLSSADDLAKFTISVFETGFFSSQNRQLLSTPAKLADGKPVVMQDGKSRYGFGWIISYNEKDEVDWIGHNGETNGAYALVRYFPRCHLSVGALVNYNIMAKEPIFFAKVGHELPAIFAGECW